MKRVYYCKLNTIIGNLWVASTDQGLCKIALGNEDKIEFFHWLKKHFTEIKEDDRKNRHITHQLMKYFGGELRTFQIDCHLIGTDFQKRIWETLIKIPYGEIRSYKDIAVEAGIPKGYRAVGMANNRNNIPIIIPCHRVVGHDGGLVGYGGGLDIKIRLLELEGRSIYRGKVAIES
ncbi:methylated-DNA--[protein]-cysteine S-methyltransferase [Clostridiaceae bacterium 35-E11]